MKQNGSTLKRRFDPVALIAGASSGIMQFGSLLRFNGATLSATYVANKGFLQSFAEGIAAEMRPMA